jgi:hypothetical protein
MLTGFWWETPEGKRPLERPRRRWDSNIKKDLYEVVWEIWTGLFRLRIDTGGGLFETR